MIELAGEHEVELFTDRMLVEELADVLHRKKLAKAVRATGSSAAQMLRHYRRLAHLVDARTLARQVSRDADDDAVLACALAAHADLIVTGDDDLLSLGCFEGIEIVTAKQAVERVGG